jgi:predicted MFS family arabinose efflux permease
MVCGIAMAASLYDPAFATLGRIFGQAARRPITLLTFVGGFSSTLSWPVTHLLTGAAGWRGTYLIYAIALAVVAAPLHAFALPRWRAEAQASKRVQAAQPAHRSAGLPFYWVMAGFAAYAFISSGLSAHLLAIFARAGIHAGTVVTIGALFGPAQVLARLCEFLFADHAHPLYLARFAMGVMVAALALLLTVGSSAPVAVAFMLMFGLCNGLVMIARGTVPLTLFGVSGFGLLMGRLASPWLAMQAAGPLVLAYVAEHASDRIALTLTAAFAIVALGCFVLLRQPRC